MEKKFVLLLLVVILLISACASEQADVSVTEDTEAVNEAAFPDETSDQSIPEPETTEVTEITEEPENTASTENAAEIEPPIENSDSISRSITLDASELRPDNGIWALGGNRLYFGVYEGSPIVYRVLASPGTQTFADDAEGLFLDCDTVLELKKYDDNFKRNDGQIKLPSEWKSSDIEVWLNGNEFYGSSAVFSTIEKAAIICTTLDAESAPYTIGNWTYEDYSSANHVFLISAAEANQLYSENAARAKDGRSDVWWLRSAFGSSGNGAGSIHGDGHICNNSISIFGVGVSPALNIDLSSILFVSAVGTDKSLDLTEAGAKVDYNTSRKWKLTLLDTSMTVKLTEGQTVTRSDTDAGSVITIPYTYAGNAANQISVMITDKPHADNSAQVLYYGALQDMSPDSKTGEGTFTLPSELEKQICGINYYVYIIAETVNGTYETDYGSDFFEILIPAASVTGSE